MFSLIKGFYHMYFDKPVFKVLFIILPRIRTPATMSAVTRLTTNLSHLMQISGLFF